MGSEELIRKCLDAVRELPTLPSIFERVNRVIDNPQSSAKDVYAIVQEDPALSARILKIANSPFYGLPKGVSSVELAIPLVGFTTIRNVALSAFVFDVFSPAEGEFDSTGFWIHSMGCAVCTRILGQKCLKDVKRDFFTLGLLHDIGKIVIAQFMPGESRIISGIVREKKIPVREAERIVLGVDHSYVGGKLAEKWKFPDDLVYAITHHHDLSGDGNIEAAGLVSVSNVVVKALCLGSSGDLRITGIDEKAWEFLGLSPDDIGPIMDKVLDDMNGMGPFLETVRTQKQ